MFPTYDYCAEKRGPTELILVRIAYSLGKYFSSEDLTTLEKIISKKCSHEIQILLNKN